MSYWGGQGWQQPDYGNCGDSYGGGYGGSCGGGYGNSNTFVLIVVLFILLVIVGAVFYK